MEGVEVSFGAVGVPQEKVKTDINFLNVSLDSAANMTLTVNSLRAGFDNSDPPLWYNVEVIELPTGTCMCGWYGDLRSRKVSSYSCPSVCLSVTEGQQKRFDLDTQDAVSLAING